jgi:hypothetical protein
VGSQQLRNQIKHRTAFGRFSFVVVGFGEMKRYPPKASERGPTPVLDYGNVEAAHAVQKSQKRRVINRIEIAVAVTSVIAAITIVCYLWNFFSNRHS